MRRDFVEPPLGLGQDGFPLLMQKRGEQQEPRVLDLETTASFADAALAQNEDLLAPPQRVDDNGPFFERRSHRSTLS